MTPYMFNLTNRLITKNLKIRLVKTLKLKKIRHEKSLINTKKTGFSRFIPFYFNLPLSQSINEAKLNGLV